MPSLREEPGVRSVSMNALDAAPAVLPAGLANAKPASSVLNESRASRPGLGRAPYTALLVRSVCLSAIGALALVAVACTSPAGSSSFLSSPSRAPLSGFEAASRPGNPAAAPIVVPVGIVPAPAEPVLVVPALGENHEQSPAMAPTVTPAPVVPVPAATVAPSPIPPTVVPTTAPTIAPTAVPTVAAAAPTAAAASSKAVASQDQRQLAAKADGDFRPQPSSRGQVRPAEPTPKPLSKSQQFIQAMAGPAQESQRATGVPASVTIAQAILESDWGNSKLARDGNNYFGIKADRVQGTAGTITLPTREVIGGQSIVVEARFRAYESVTDSLVDHGRYFVGNRRYAKALENGNDPKEFARQIALAGYATDPAYAPKLIRLMDTYGLYDFDLPGE